MVNKFVLNEISFHGKGSFGGAQVPPVVKKAFVVKPFSSVKIGVSV